jgi:hypothetical protein
MHSRILKEVYEFDRNSAEKVKIVLEEYNRKRYVDVRVYYDASDNAVPDWRPTKKGICLSPELIEELHEGIEKALATLEEFAGGNTTASAS